MHPEPLLPSWITNIHSDMLFKHYVPPVAYDWYGKPIPTGSTLIEQGPDKCIKYPDGTIIKGPSVAEQQAAYAQKSVHFDTPAYDLKGDSVVYDNFTVSEGKGWASASSAEILKNVTAWKDSIEKSGAAMKHAAYANKVANKVAYELKKVMIEKQADQTWAIASGHRLIDHEASTISPCDCDATEDHGVNGLDYDGDDSYGDGDLDTDDSEANPW